jgi:acetyl esterase/lipase
MFHPFARRIVYAFACVMCLCSISAAATGDAPPAGPQKFLDVPYVPGGDKAQSLDIYTPGGAGKALPTLVWIHGGGWSAGDKAGCPAYGMVGHGYVAVSINYRLTGQAPWPAQIYDCKAAIRFLRAHAAEYQIDPNRIGVWGASAGGHLVAMLGVTGGVKELEGTEGDAESLKQSSKVQAVCDWFGPTDILALVNEATGTHLSPDVPVDDATKAKLGKAWHGGLISALLGGAIWDHYDTAKQASPMTYVTKDAAPILIMQGTADPLVPMDQSKMLDAALKKAGADSTLVLIEGAGHGTGGFGKAETLLAVAAFFDKHLGVGPTTKGQ